MGYAHQRFSRLLPVFSLLLLLGCAGPIKERPNDPLIGRIYDTSNGQELSPEQFLRRAESADVLYLGEKHDNAEHHARQLEIIQSLVDRGLTPAIGFEFFDVGETGYLKQYVEGTGSSLKIAGSKSKKSQEQWLRKRLGWQDASEEYWGFYFSLVDLAKTHKLEVFGADLPSGVKSRLSRVGLKGLNPVELSLLTPTGLEDDAYRQLMYEAFRQGHCGWGEEELLKRLYQTWIARNDRMAMSIVQIVEDNTARPVVVILGNGHIQHSQGVFERVAHLNPRLRQINLGFREVSSSPHPLPYYLKTERAGGKEFPPDHQVIWFSSRQDYGDPCAGIPTPQ
ncbi:ChaN family lipoprotein [Motiliproteus sp. MSK22-1]|uniref:ChaN family lipoprotein n=1 Tax=Motiliproteus sp. MSK22-1 TaxID=1897630 RepID=UPI0009783C6A|nr:ChaN family lipoprotein [Motiliproteus sp. MSK22-1]OMH25900.1 hypothetical protein BGP75_25655 [Motiliproteus sp. MSK22-1]